MTARRILVLLIEDAWHFDPGDPQTLIVLADQDSVHLNRIGTDETIKLSRDDWTDLITFVAAQMIPSVPPISPATADEPLSRLEATRQRCVLIGVNTAAAPTVAPLAGRPRRPIDEDSIIAQLQHLGAADHVMPTARQWNEFASANNLPTASLLIRHAKWSAWAQRAGLDLLRPYQRAQAGRKDGAGATAAPFPAAQ